MKCSIDYLRKNCERVLREKGIDAEDAFVIVDTMLLSDMSGIKTHGIKMLPSYLEKLGNGEFATCNLEIKKSTASFTILDAKNTIGAVSASKATDIAIKKAKASGLHAVFVRHGNTFGAAFYYAEMISKAGMIGFICCNSPAAMPVNNGLEVMLGTNPFAFSCPSKSKGTILIDMATSVVAKSNFLIAKDKGEKLEDGWALDCNGKPTKDPLEAIKGFILPMAGYKGYGIALIIDLLSGMLSGSGYLNKVGKFYSIDGKPMNVGYLIIAIDPLQIYEGDFLGDMDEYIRLIRNSKAIEGKIISIPGDRKYINRKIAEKEGIELDSYVIKELEGIFNS